MTVPEGISTNPQPEKPIGPVHTLPSEFLSGRSGGSKPQKAGGSSKKGFWGLVIFAGVLAVVAGGLWAYLRLGTSDTNTNEENTNVALTNAVNRAVGENPSNDNSENEETPSPVINVNNNNTNVETNENTNFLNDNSNDNENANSDGSNENDDENSNVSLNVNTGGSTNDILPPGSNDADDDGLTDTEEELYGSDPEKPDSDSDSYRDGDEVLNAYSPQSGDRATLEDDELASRYTNATQGYLILSPSAWTIGATSDVEDEVLFTSDNDEFVEVLTQDNPSKLTPEEWVKQQFEDFPDLQEGTSMTINDAPSVLGADRATVYIANGDVMFIIHYNVSGKQEADFETTFTMMYRSFVITPTIQL